MLAILFFQTGSLTEVAGLASHKTPAILLLQLPLQGGLDTTLDFLDVDSRDPAQVLSLLANKQFTSWDFRLLFCFVF